jgi:hypothetical protein
MKTPLIGSVCLVLSLAAIGALDQPVKESMEVRETYARAGDPSALFNLGLVYARGEGVEKDPAKAFAYFKAAADKGFPEAQYNLGICYYNGAGVAKDEKAAVRWCSAAARQGLLAAQTLMVRNYVTGTGVEKSPAKALAWDFIARRTLTLRKGIDPGPPAAPGQQRADGAVEQTDATGRKVWVLPDHGRETQEPNGTRVIVYPGGITATITSDGVRETRLPSGDVEWRMPDGTQILMNDEGATRAQFPDGRVESKDGQGGVQVVFPDGSKTIEGPGTMASGESVQIKESYDAQGKLKSKRIAERDRTLEVLPDKTFTAEYAGQDPDGKPLTLIESYDAQGELLGRELVKPDGTQREGTEEWTIVRWNLDPADRTQRLHVRETYGLGGSTTKQEVLAKEAIPPQKPKPAPVARTGPIMFKMPSLPVNGTPAAGPAGSASAATAPQGDPEVKLTLDTLKEVETLSRNFAGATDADYKTAQAQAAQYVIPFDNAPQKSELNWMKFKTARLTPPVPRLQEVPTDLSKKYPFGHNGQEAINERAWKHAESDHFVVHYTDLASVKPVIDYIENAYCVVVQLLQVEEARGAAKSHVFVFPDSPSWLAWLGKHNLPPQVAGYAYKAELLFGAGQDKDDYIKTICHEATHAIVARYYPGRRLPLWLNEGLADYSASRAIALKRNQKLQKFLGAGTIDRDLRPVFARKGYEDAPKASAPASGPKMVRAFDPAGQLAEIEKLRTFYRTSERCVMALNEHVDSANFPKFVNLLAAGNPTDLALRTAYGNACASPEALAKLLDP